MHLAVVWGKTLLTTMLACCDCALQDAGPIPIGARHSVVLLIQTPETRSCGSYRVLLRAVDGAGLRDLALVVCNGAKADAFTES